MTLAALGSAGFIEDTSLAGGQKSSYSFTVTVLDPSSRYEAKATPISDLTTARHFFVDASGLVRQEVGAEATENSPPLQ